MARREAACWAVFFEEKGVVRDPKVCGPVEGCERTSSQANWRPRAYSL